jgi:hypothetical protein
MRVASSSPPATRGRSEQLTQTRTRIQFHEVVSGWVLDSVTTPVVQGLGTEVKLWPMMF